MPITWECGQCGNVNLIKNSKCLKCNAERDNQLNTEGIFYWQCKSKYNENIQCASYNIGILRFDMVKHSDYTEIRCMLKPYVEGKINNRYISCDKVIAKGISDVEIVNEINKWLKDFNKKTDISIDIK